MTLNSLAACCYPQHLSDDQLVSQTLVQQQVQMALAEDLGVSQFTPSALTLDVSVQLIAPTQHVEAHIICRDEAIIAGIAWAHEAFMQVDSELAINWLVVDGDAVLPNTCLVKLSGSAQAILTAERTALNFLQTLSATATQTKYMVTQLKGTGIRLLDTRKTLPNLRLAQKYAVKCGGGHNHRIGLYDMFLIKENHIIACGGISQAIAAARQLHPTLRCEIEVENLHELKQAVTAGADVVMLDNFSIADMRSAVAIAKGQTELEISGNVTLADLRELGDIGVDYISSGALTKHIQAIDLSLRILT